MAFLRRQQNLNIYNIEIDLIVSVAVASVRAASTSTATRFGEQRRFASFKMPLRVRRQNTTKLLQPLNTPSPYADNVEAAKIVIFFPPFANGCPARRFCPFLMEPAACECVPNRLTIKRKNQCDCHSSTIRYYDADSSHSWMGLAVEKNNVACL